MVCRGERLGAGRCISIGISQRVTQVFYERKNGEERAELREESGEERGVREELRGERDPCLLRMKRWSLLTAKVPVIRTKDWGSP